MSRKTDEGTKFISKSSIDVSQYNDLEVSLRTTPLELSEMWRIGVIMFGEPVLVGLGFKLNVHGIKLKADDYVKVGGVTITAKEILEKLKTQDGYDSARTSQGKDSSKKILTLLRIARCTAATTIKLLDKLHHLIPPEMLKAAEDCKLPVKYAFLAAPYGMTNEEIDPLVGPLGAYAEWFDNQIAKAYNNKWMTGTDRHSHYKSLESYLEWRGLK